jgi:D-3-phosphoglycerate dehydrogenase
VVKVLITSRSFGQIGDASRAILHDEGYEVIYNNAPFVMDIFDQQIETVDALIIGAHLITDAQMGRARKLKIIAKHGAGLDNIDLEAAAKYGIKVTNTPGVNANAVADLTMGMMINCSRKLHFGFASVMRGEWQRVIGHDVSKKKLGLLGFGNIAKCVAKRAAGFDMSIITADPHIASIPKEYDNVKRVSFEELIMTADIISVHMPLNEETRNLLNYQSFKKMKKGVIIINTSRGGIIDEADLLKAIREDHVAAAGLDVLSIEPPDNNPLLACNEVFITPHMGMYSYEAIDRVSIICSENIVNALKGKPLQFEVV